MHEVRDHRGATAQDEVRQRAAADGTVVVETRPPGSFAEAVTLTTLAVADDGDVITANGRGRQNILRLSGDTLEVLWDVRVPGGVRWRQKKAAGRRGVVLQAFTAATATADS